MSNEQDKQVIEAEIQTVKIVIEKENLTPGSRVTFSPACLEDELPAAATLLAVAGKMVISGKLGVSLDIGDEIKIRPDSESEGEVENGRVAYLAQFGFEGGFFEIVNVSETIDAHVTVTIDRFLYEV